MKTIIETEKNILNKKNENSLKYINIYNYYKLLKISIFFFLILNYPSNNLTNKNVINFNYHNYQRDFINEKMKKYAGWQQINDQPYFINGIIRKLKPKNCLEIGVAEGGSAIIILNALRDIKGSKLVSLDITTNNYVKKNLLTGHRVKEYFPELMNKWQLFTGEQPHIFLEKLNLTFDFLFLDTVHLSPGEYINFIEALPFLKEKAIVVLHDIMYHLPTNMYYNPNFVKYHPSQIFLMTSLIGDKVIIKTKNNKYDNIGAVFLYPNQKKYYLNYFLLLLSPWEYIPNEKHIKELKIFIKKYYKDKIFIDLFNTSIEENKIYVNKFHNFIKNHSKIDLI